MTSAQPVLTEVVDGIGIITMNRPESRNAVNGPLAAALDAAVKDMAGNRDVRVVVLTGASSEGHWGGFCSGGDLRAGPSDREGLALGVPADALTGDLSRHDLQASMLLHLMPKPTIAMIGGPAVGAGFSLAGACDLRFASEDAVLRSGFVGNGLCGDYGGSFFWTGIVGTAAARRLYFLNETITALDGLRLGMVHEVTPGPQLRDFTLKQARQLAAVPPELIRLVKENLNQAEESADRRRFLFASECENQHASGRMAVERFNRRGQSRGVGSAEEPGSSR